ncbi:MAG: ABC transporter permease [Gemmatimonadetes bacterium]|nr:ABC transporter permease [Gemmatimonadota bacterium]
MTRPQRHRVDATTLLTVGGIVALTLAGPALAPYAPTEALDPQRLAWQPPSAQFLLGTDGFSRDVLSRFLVGARHTLGVALLAAGVALVLGTAVGLGAALAGRWRESFLMRCTDALLAMPRLLVLLLVVTGTGALRLDALALVLGATGWMTTARLVRQETRRLLATDALRGAIVLGVPPARLVTHHLLPALAPTLAVAATGAFASAVPLESGLSYLGLGVPTPLPSWGNIIAEAEGDLLRRWWVVVFPTAAIVGTVLLANRVAERLTHGDAP